MRAQSARATGRWGYFVQQESKSHKVPSSTRHTHASHAHIKRRVPSSPKGEDNKKKTAPDGERGRFLFGLWLSLDRIVHGELDRVRHGFVCLHLCVAQLEVSFDEVLGE